MSQFAVQWSEFEMPRLVNAEEAVLAGKMVRTALRAGVRAGAKVAAAAMFAGVMWLLLAGPGFLDGGSGTADHAPQRSAERHAR